MAGDLTEENVSLCLEQIIKEHIGEDVELTPETNLRDEFDIDSLEFVELSIKIEGKFGIKLPNAEVRRCTTPADMVQLVLRTARSTSIEAEQTRK